MSIIRPPVTGDFALDSFLNQLVTELSNTSFATAGLESSVLAFDSNSYSATLYLYKRTTSNTQPDPVSIEVDYFYRNGDIKVNGSVVNIVDGWYFNTPPPITDGEFYWQTYVHISSDLRRETIPASSWSVPEIVGADLTIGGIPLPSRPTEVSFVQTTQDSGILSWTINAKDLGHPGLYSEIQTAYDFQDGSELEWVPYAYITDESESIEIGGLTSLDVKKSFRVRVGNVLINQVSDWSNVRSFTPSLPNIPTNLQITRNGLDTALLTWEYIPNFSKVQFFEIEVEYGNGVYDLKTTAGSLETSVVLEGVGSIGGNVTYRMRAHSFNDKHSPYSDIVELGPLTPATPSSIKFIRNSKNIGTLSWDMVDNFAPLSHFNIEESVGDENNFTLVGSIDASKKSYQKTGLTSEDDTIYFRIQAIGINRIESEYSASASFIPATPNTPINLTYTKLNLEEGKLTWDYEENYATVRNFIIQIKEASELNYTTAATVDGEDRDYIISGLSVRKKTFDYRIIAVSLHGKRSIPSSVVSVAPSATVPPTELTVSSVEQVGTVTSVKLSWTPPDDIFNQYSIITAQLFHDSDQTWKDVATVPAESNTVEFQPSRQGTLQFRVRSTAVNGSTSEYSNIASVYIAGGSATDNAIYNGDSAFIATQHYSVNSDDRVLNNAGDLDVISGGSYSAGTNTVTGVTNTDLVIYWWVDITNTMVNRKRHFYLNLDNLENTSIESVPWAIDKGNVQVEVLTSPDDTVGFYINDGSGSNNYIYVGSGQSEADIRTYSDRQPDFMYADREYISLTMKRTFTFRQSSRAVLKLTFKAVVNDAPIINLNSGNELRLDAYASELIDDYDDLAITNDAADPDGTLWTFSENFEAAPKIFITPNINTNTWVTDKSATSCRIHAVDDCTVDLTARGR